jgi:hypothetical protein
MKQPPTLRQIVTQFYLDRLLFCLLGIVESIIFMGLLISAGREGTVFGIPILVLQIVSGLIMLGSFLWSLSLGDCPSCGHSPYHNSQNPFPATYKHCGVRLL